MLLLYIMRWQVGPISLIININIIRMGIDIVGIIGTIAITIAIVTTTYYHSYD